MILKVFCKCVRNIFQFKMTRLRLLYNFIYLKFSNFQQIQRKAVPDPWPAILYKRLPSDCSQRV